MCITIHRKRREGLNLEEWKSQIKRGTLEYCILLLIAKKPRYGYEIIGELSQYPMIAATESTIYPLLRRLLNDRCLTSSWKESSEGLPPRKYYFITEDGEKYLKSMIEEWQNLIEIVEKIKGGE